MLLHHLLLNKLNDEAPPVSAICLAWIDVSNSNSVITYAALSLHAIRSLGFYYIVPIQIVSYDDVLCDLYSLVHFLRQLSDCMLDWFAYLCF